SAASIIQVWRRCPSLEEHEGGPMRLSMSAVAAACLVLTGEFRACADDVARTVVEKAIKAMGGLEVLGQPLAAHYKMRGKIPLGPAGKEEFPFTGEVFTQPNGDFKYVFDLNANQLGIGFTMALVGEKGWRSVGGMLENLDDASLAELKLGRYYDRVTT